MQLTSLFSGCQSNALPSLPWSDWEIDPRDITICRREDGSDYKLGAGAYGTVRRVTDKFSPFSFCVRRT